MIPRTLELPEDSRTSVESSLDDVETPPSATLPLSDTAADVIRSRKRFSVGDCCASTRGKHGRVYFTIAEVQDDGGGSYVISHDACWSKGGGPAGFFGGHYACGIGEVERRLTSEQWEYLRSDGFPLGIVGALRNAGLYYDAPARVATRTDVEISRVEGGGDFAKYTARVLDETFETILFPALHDATSRMGFTWLARPKAPTLRYLADRLTPLRHDLEIVQAAVERYLTTDVNGGDDLLEDDEERA